MKIKNIHINLLFLILGIISLQLISFDSTLAGNSFLETEIEASIDDINEVDDDKKFSESYPDGGNNAIISNQYFHFLNPLDKSKIGIIKPKDLLKKPRLFLLYCCLKLDC